MRVCVRCNLEKDDTEFWKSKNKSGFQKYCKSCMKEKSTEYRRRKGLKERQPRTFDEIPNSKICTRCKVEKEKSQFRIRLGKKKYWMMNATCMDCDAEISKAYYQRIKDNEDFKKKNRERQKIYAEKHPDQIRKLNNRPERKKKKAQIEMKRYKKMRDVICARQKIKRQTPEYKKMMKEYRENNKEKIYEQEVVTKKRYHEKNRDSITDKYCIHQLRQQGISEITPELIEWERGQILVARLKKKVSGHKIGKTKICTSCKQEKDLVEFVLIKKKGTRIAQCRSCNSEKCKVYREKRKNGNQ